MKGSLTCRVTRDEHHSIGGDFDATASYFGDEGSKRSWAVSPLIEEIWNNMEQFCLVRFFKSRMAPFSCKFKRLSSSELFQWLSSSESLLHFFNVILCSEIPHGYSCEPCKGQEFQHWFADTCCAEVALHSVIFCVVLQNLHEIARMMHRRQRLHPLRPSVTIVLIQVVYRV